MDDKTWTAEKVKIAFDRFIAEYGRLPMAPEVDSTAYLPSSRQIQRKFGGLKALRSQLGYDITDFGSGSNRSSIASSHNSRGKEAERALEQQLSDLFGEVYVHSEKYYGQGKNRADFIVYTADGIFGIDVFTTETTHDLQKNVAIKIDKYLDFPKSVKLYFVVVSTTLDEVTVSKAVSSMQKTTLLPELKVLTPAELFTEVEKWRAYAPPTGFVSVFHKP